MNKKYETLGHNGHVLAMRVTGVQPRAGPNDTDRFISYVFVKPHRPNVLVVPITAKNELVLVKHYRPSIDKNCWEFPGGAIENGETAETAGRRELLEETGYGCSEQFEVLCDGYDRGGLVANTLAVLVARPVRMAISGARQYDITRRAEGITEVGCFSKAEALTLENRMAWIDMFINSGGMERYRI